MVEGCGGGGRGAGGAGGAAGRNAFASHHYRLQILPTTLLIRRNLYKILEKKEVLLPDDIYNIYNS